jgi:hypothetical protein
MITTDIIAMPTKPDNWPRLVIQEEISVNFASVDCAVNQSKAGKSDKSATSNKLNLTCFFVFLVKVSIIDLNALKHKRLRENKNSENKDFASEFLRYMT